MDANNLMEKKMALSEDAIEMKFEYITIELNELKSEIKSLPEKLEKAIVLHQQLCRGAKFFEDPSDVKILADVLYSHRNKEKKAEWFRWMMSLPIAGIVIERILHYIKDLK